MKSCLRLLASCLLVWGIAISARAANVTVAAYTYPGFQPSNVTMQPVDVPVNVLTGSTFVVAAQANGFRAQWVGVGGHTIEIGGVRYTIASIQNTGLIYLTTPYAGASANNVTMRMFPFVEVRIFRDKAYQSNQAAYITQPGALQNSPWYRRYAASIINDGALSTLYVPQMTIESTTDGLPTNTAFLTKAFFTPGNGIAGTGATLISVWQCSSKAQFRLPPATPTTWTEICQYNSTVNLQPSTTTYTADQINQLLPNCNPDNLAYYRVAGRALSCLALGTNLSITNGVLNAAGGGGGGTPLTIKNANVAVTQRDNLNLLDGLRAADNTAITATDLRTANVPTGVINAITDANMSGDNRVWAVGGTGYVSGSSTVTLTGSTIDAFNEEITYAPVLLPLGTHSFRPGQGVALIGAGPAGATLYSSVVSVTTTTLTIADIISTNVAPASAQLKHDDTVAFQAAINSAISTHRKIYVPPGVYPLRTDYLSLTNNSEAYWQQLVIVGAGPFLSRFKFTGAGNGLNLQQNSYFFELRGVAWEANVFSAQEGNGINGSSATYDGTGLIPQTAQTRWLVEDCYFIGWGRWAIYTDNLQSSTIRRNYFGYSKSGAVAMVATSSLRGTSQTEPNVNRLTDNFIQYGRTVVDSPRVVLDAVTTAASDVVTSASAAFTSADIRKIVRLRGVSVNGTDTYGQITEIISSTSARISARPFTSGVGVSLTVYATNVAHVFGVNAHNLQIGGGTWQGNWANGGPGSGIGAAAGGVCAIRLEFCDTPHIDYLWNEDGGGTAGAAIYLYGSRNALITNSNFKSDIDATAPVDDVGYGIALLLEDVRGCTIENSYIGAQAAPAIIRRGTTIGVTVKNSWIGDSYRSNALHTAGEGIEPLAFDGGVNQPVEGFRWTEHLTENLLSNTLSNPNFLDGLTGWSTPTAGFVTQPGYPYASLPDRYSRYVTVNGQAAATGTALVLTQTYSVPDSFPSRIWSLGFDYYIESRGPDAGGNVTSGNELKVKLVASPSSGNYAVHEMNINPTAAQGHVVGKWQRHQIFVLLPAGASRTLAVEVRADGGAPAGIFRLANFRLTEGRFAPHDAAIPITEETAMPKLRALAGSGTRMVVADTMGLLSTQPIGSGGGSGSASYIFTAASSYTRTSTITHIDASATSGAQAINLDVPGGMPVEVKKYDTSTNAVTITYGASTLVLDAPGAFAKFVPNGANWVLWAVDASFGGYLSNGSYVTTTAASYTRTAGIAYVDANAASNAQAINIGSPDIIVEVRKSDATYNAVTVTYGAATHTLVSPGQAVRFVPNGAAWVRWGVN